MSEQNNDNIENFFRDHAQNHNIEFSDADWKKLEARLDEEFPVVSSFWSFFRKFLILPLLLVLAPLLWFTVNHYSQDQQSQLVEEASTEDIGEDYLPAGRNSNSEQVVIPDRETQANASDRLENEGSIQEGRQNEKNEVATLIDDLIEVRGINDAVGADEAQYANKDEEKIGYAVSEDGAYFASNLAISELHFLFSIPPASAITTHSPTISSTKINPILYPEQASKVSFAIGAGYSPDFSTVGIGGFVSPGSRWAATFEVGFNNRFLINTGVIWVNNKYKAVEEDYTSSSSYGPRTVSSDETYGECTMIDIPLNLRYNVWIEKRHQLFISGGASTYLVLSQDYYFQNSQNNPNQPDQWSSDEMAAYPFSIINFSIGYQYALGRKGAFQVEPFIKIPTTGIGYVDVDLHTIGAYFMYKYRLGQ